jgi:hypothetical protein
MFQLKTLTKEGIAAALRKVERYRLLNEPWEAESICLDIIETDPTNQDALVQLLLSLTDQFRSARGATRKEAQVLLPRLQSEYHRAYYAGIICERQAAVHLERNATGDGPIAYDWLRQAMEWYERAGALRAPGNDDAILRWNTCARAIMRHPHVRPPVEIEQPVMLE